MIDPHLIGKRRIEAVQAQALRKPQRVLLRHVELAAEAADIVHRFRLEADAIGGHDAQMEAGEMVRAENDDALGIEVVDRVDAIADRAR